MFIALAVALDLEIHQMLKQLFSKHLSEEVYMEQPEGFVCRATRDKHQRPEKFVHSGKPLMNGIRDWT